MPNRAERYEMELSCSEAPFNRTGLIVERDTPGLARIQVGPGDGDERAPDTGSVVWLDMGDVRNLQGSQ